MTLANKILRSIVGSTSMIVLLQGVPIFEGELYSLPH